MGQVDTLTTYFDKVVLARQPTCPSSSLDTLAKECKSEDYSLCEALLLNESLSSYALETLLIKKPILIDHQLQVLAARHPRLSEINDKTKLLALCSPARQVLLTRSDLPNDIAAALCLDPIPEIRNKAQFKFSNKG